MPQERRRVACRECRLQKIRCDAEYPDACTRCRRLGLDCAKSVNSGARKTKAQLQRELERLKSQSSPPRPDLTGSNAEGQDKDRLLFLPDQASPIGAAAAAVAAAAVPVNPANSTARSLEALEPVTPTAPSLLPFEIAAPRAGSELPTPSSDTEQCASRFLDGQEVDRHKIRDCFSIFFTQYSSLLPIVDASLTPDKCFQLSPFLFWTIVFVGSRRYSRDPTLFLSLVPRINPMALQALGTRANPIQTIQGLLILCVWPVPLNSTYKDITSVLSGAATQLAMQTGLHVVGSGDDFARTRLDFTYEDKLYRSQLWTHCVIISHETALREGVPPMTIGCSPMLGSEDEALLSNYPEDLKLRRKMHNIMVSATTAIMKVLQDPYSSAKSRALAPFLSLFDAQMVDVVRQCDSAISLLYAQNYRVHLLSFYFYEMTSPEHDTAMIQVHSAACAFLNALSDEDQKSNLSQICPVFLERTMSLAACAVLKISRSPLSTHCSHDASEKAFFSSILFNRRVSLQNDDLGARGVTLMSQLWTSKNIFRHANGTIHSLGTRIRSRLSMSVVFDCFWWWREEFGGQPSPYRDDSQSTPDDSSGQQAYDTTHGPEQENLHGLDAGFNGISIVPDGPFPDFDWAANFDFSEVNWSPSAFPGMSMG